MSAMVIALPLYRLGQEDANNQNLYSNHFIFKSHHGEVWILLQFHIPGVLMHSNQETRADRCIDIIVIQKSVKSQGRDERRSHLSDCIYILLQYMLRLCAILSHVQ